MPADFLIIPTNGNIGGKTYDQYIADYWNFLLGPDPDNPIFGASPALFTRACYNYKDVQSLQDLRRRSFCGLSEETPSIIHSVGTRNNPFNLGANIPVFATVLDTIALTPEVDENANTVTPEDVLQEENDAVRRKDVRLTIQRQNGGGQPESIDVFKNHRHGPTPPFNLNVPQGSILADRMERPIRPGPYPNAIAEGFYVLIQFINPGVYRIKSRSSGVREYKSITDYHIRIQ
jgi:hypothetical protein